MENSETVHMFIAIRHKKYNDTGKQEWLRKIIKNHEIDLDILKLCLAHRGGRWGIYKTINSRSLKKASKLLFQRYIDNPDKISNNFESEYKSALLHPTCKVGRKLLLDVGTKNGELLAELTKRLVSQNVNFEAVEGPGGWHFVVENLDTRFVKDLEYVDVLRDGYRFVQIFDV